MSSSTFDAFSAAGVERSQAEAIASALAAQTVTRTDLKPLATKAEMRSVRYRRPQETAAPARSAGRTP